MPTKVFWCDYTGEGQIYFRRYATVAGSPCPANNAYHDAQTPWMRMLWPIVGGRLAVLPDAPADAPWPTRCEGCDHVFAEGDARQVFGRPLYRRVDTGEEFEWDKAPAGAMRDCWWMPDRYRGSDGIALEVMLPVPRGHGWTVDGPCSNCTRPGEAHKCWIRHGDPRTGNVHVDKAGNTCSAGAGSIMVPGYHGFLHHGYLTDG